MAIGHHSDSLFRLTADDAVINRYGFNSKGMRVAATHLSSRSTRHGILGVNIGANKLSQDKAADYHKSAAHLSRFADYLTVNLSSPNTPGLRDLQHEEGLRACLQAAFDGRDDACGPKAGRPPIFVKLAPDLDAAELFRSMDIALDCGISGFILTNTTTSRPENLSSALKDEAGGLSGQPLTFLALQKIAEAAKKLIVGDPTDAATEVGPLIRHRETDRVEAWVNEAVAAGAELLCGGKRISDSCFEATVLLNPPSDCKVSQAEIFGPVVCVYSVENVDAAIARANDVPFSFQASVFTGSIDTAMRAYRRLNASAVMVNEHTAFRVDWMPFAGLKQSGLAVGGISFTMHDMQVRKMLVLHSEELRP